MMSLHHMNITELARRLRVAPNVLLELLPKMGFDIGKRAIKVDPRTAQRIIREWKIKIADLERQQQQEKAKAEKLQRMEQQTAPIILPAFIVVREFAERLSLPVTSVIKELMRQGILATVNEMIDYETASIIAQDLGFRTQAEEETKSSVEKELEKLTSVAPVARGAVDEAGLQPRPPVVVVMGHIDHGKTKLLDAIRKTHVMEHEHGGITQHIGAYHIELRDRGITFIDTPGHEAFMSMRARGARIADIAILVVAADDGVKPQTLEAIQIIKGAELPMVVAINKIDKPDANIDKTKKELADHGVLSEEWGGKIPTVPISAKDGKGITELLEMILLVADLSQDKLRATPGAEARGTIIESRIDKREGVVATILVQDGTLRRNDPLVINGMLYGKVRLMRDDRGEVLESAGPSSPVRILGFKVAPTVGDIVEATQVSERLEKANQTTDRSKQLLDAFARVGSREPSASGKTHVIPLVIKADVLGSLEAILSEIQKLEHAEVALQVIGRGLGALTDADIIRARDTGALAIGFNVNALPTAQHLAREEKVPIRSYTVIYQLLDDLKLEMESKLAPEIKKIPLGTIHVIKCFTHTGRLYTVGARVMEGRVVPKDVVDILRAGVSIGRGTVAGLQKGKEATKEVGSGQECGIRVDTRVEVMEGDQLIPYREEKVERTLES